MRHVTNTRFCDSVDAARHQRLLCMSHRWMRHVINPSFVCHIRVGGCGTSSTLRLYVTLVDAARRQPFVCTSHRLFRHVTNPFVCTSHRWMQHVTNAWFVCHISGCSKSPTLGLCATSLNAASHQRLVCVPHHWMRHNANAWFVCHVSGCGTMPTELIIIR